MKKIVSLFIYFIVFSFSFAQDAVLEDITYNDNIKSVKLFRPEWNLSNPIISLNTDDKLVLHFDFLGDGIETYYYTFIHCSKDWQQSDIFQSDYIQGFTENQIRDYSMSFNTTVNFVHYSLIFPNEDVSFKYSGNYIIKVYQQSNSENPVLYKRFMISENKANIVAKVLKPTQTTMYDKGQQIDFTVEYPSNIINDPHRTIYATILQNGKWDNAKNSIKPNFIGNNTLTFSDISGSCTFKAGNEFRYFDIKSLRYQTEYIRSIDMVSGYNHVYLLPSSSRFGLQYFYHQDFNGKYYTAIQEGRDFEIEADYVYVYFTLHSNFPVDNGDVFVYGGLTDWKLGLNNKMIYNSQTHKYECSLLLKQGWYNYMYVVGEERGKINSFQPFENDHFDTENDYQILIYLSEPMARYDRLIGTKAVNSFKR